MRSFLSHTTVRKEDDDVGLGRVYMAVVLGLGWCWLLFVIFVLIFEFGEEMGDRPERMFIPRERERSMEGKGANVGV